MSLALPNLSWLLSYKRKDTVLQNGSFANSSAKLNAQELDVLNFPSSSGINKGTPGRARRKWDSHEEGKLDREYDIVLVPSDGECFSDCESDDSNWSIGWSEPHGPGFLSEGEIEGGFGVLVPCYGLGRRSGGKLESKKNNINYIANVPELYSAEGKKYMEKWLSSLRSN